MRRLPVTVIAFLALLAAAPGDGAAVDPALAQTPATAPAGRLSLRNGQIAFTPPPAEEGFRLIAVTKDDHGIVRGAVFEGPGGTSVMIDIFGGAAPRDERRGKLIRDAILDGVKKIARSKAADVEVVTDVEEIQDGRFFLALESRFRKAGRPQSTWRFYRNVAPHQVTTVAAAWTDEEETARKLRGAAEAMALSAEPVPRGAKPPPAPQAPAAGGEKNVQAGGEDDAPAAGAAESPEVQEAKRALDEATARVESELMKRAEYARAKRAAEAAEAKLQALRAKDPPDRAAIAQASLEWLQARNAVEKVRKEALDADPAVVEARRKLAEARKTGR